MANSTEVGMRSQFLRRFLFLFSIALWAGPVLADAQPDLSSPKKAATAFAIALQKGDFTTLKSVTTGGADDYRLMQTVTGMTAAANKLHEAIVTRFGVEEAKKLP